jgi:molybdopterin biosynthesis enzyme MoaB
MNAPFPAPGGRIDESLELVSVRIAVLTISDTRDEESDTSGHVLVERLTGAGHTLAGKAVVPDDRAAAPASPAATSRRRRSSPCSTSGSTDFR